jgi:hypothetical protein
MARLPPVTLVRQFDTHRLIPSRYSDTSVLTRIANDDEQLRALFDLDGATNDRLTASRGRLPGIGVDELVSGVPWAHVVNASFCHAHPLGGRFNGPDRGAWYAAFALQTAKAEVIFHRRVELAETNWTEAENFTYDDYLADFSAALHDLRSARGFRACLDPDSYVESQSLAETLLDAGSLGVVWPSVRQAHGTCLASFRPTVVTNVRKDAAYCFTIP